MDKFNLKEQLSKHRKKILDKKKQEIIQKEIKAIEYTRQQLVTFHFPLGSILVEDLTKLFKETIEASPHLRIVKAYIPFPENVESSKYVKQILEQDSKCSVEFLRKESRPYVCFSIEIF